jgi:hypothetical protein
MMHILFVGVSDYMAVTLFMAAGHGYLEVIPCEECKIGFDFRTVGKRTWTSR